MIFASLWLTLFSVISGLAYGAGGSIQGLFTALIAYRFLLGIGIGAEVSRYLLDSTGSDKGKLTLVSLVNSRNAHSTQLEQLHALKIPKIPESARNISKSLSFCRQTQ